MPFVICCVTGMELSYRLKKRNGPCCAYLAWLAALIPAPSWVS